MNKRKKIRKIKNLMPLEYYEFVIDFSNGKSSVFECKEEFINLCYDLPKAKDLVFIGNINIEYLNYIEELIGVPLSTISFHEKITLKDDYYDCTEDFMQFRNKFWFKNHINLDAFCCIFKSLKDLKNEKNERLDKFIISSLKRGIYFDTPTKLWSILNIKQVPKFLGNPKDQKECLFNFRNFGLVSAVTNKFNAIKYNKDNEVVKQVKAVKSQYFS